ncbi:hypothetical protein JKF63_03621 [Porcisia hertigi]|uniref:Uncharacterized protein n=1 Tax=Porcisia hertigi TaxID=2761500 RepID=A0A836L884_9TRYP|nr:hypothetical protein JKF63_03621 [Porcisia hertigi]
MTLVHCAAAAAYMSACKRENAQVSEALVEALDSDAKTAALGKKSIPLNDADICCVAELIRSLREDSQLRVLVLEENSFGLRGVTALMEAIEENPNRIRELRLGKNNLKDQAAVVIGHTLSRSGCGLKVLDLSENNITKLGVIPIVTALERPFSEIVELSFHNNQIECDAASYLSQALRAAPKLKHLHLGYNALRDNGAAQIARSVPFAACLSTLDLTANRISREGGEEMVRALMAPTCTVQRLNLRHNQLDSETIERFADVIAHNTSLIQLFLGFMNPSPESAVTVLSAIPQNHTLLLLDIYGWKLSPQNSLALVQAIQEKNSTLAALVTDACQAIAPQVDEGNLVREETRDLHPIYVGPDDRDAYLATKSLRRYSRAQSRRVSRAASRAPSRSRADGQTTSRTASLHRRSERDGSRPASRSSRAVSPAERDAVRGEAPPSQCSSSRHSRRQSGSQRRHRHRHSESTRADSATGTGAGTHPRTPHSARAPGHSSSPSSRAKPGQLITTTPRKVNVSIDVLMNDLENTSCDPQTTKVLKSIIKAMEGLIKHQRAQVEAIAARVEVLEYRRECNCGIDGDANKNSAIRHPLSGSPTSLARSPWSHTKSSANGSVYDHTNSKGGSNIHSKISISAAVDQGDFNMQNGQQRQQAQMTATAAAANTFQRSMSHISQYTSTTALERCTTPHVSHDVPPGNAHPNDESGEYRPEGVELQRSASIQSFPPRIEPSPSQDADRPLRKSVSHYF